MNLTPFETRTFGKWILAGEHTVLRGGHALVFPLKSQFLDWRFEPRSSGELEVVIPKGYPEEFKLLFWAVFEKACQLKSLKVSDFSGRLEMKAEILVGSGLGASATLCVALTRWFIQLKILDVQEGFFFAKLLEDVFHGESSGVDVAVVLSESGLMFQKGQSPQKFEAAWQPNWYLSHCGEKGITKECVHKVKTLGEKNPELLQRLDNQMKRSVQLCHSALLADAKSGMAPLVEAIILAERCFEQWGLITHKLADHMLELKNAGALAVKPTGSGGGGFVLSLWNEQGPPWERPPWERQARERSPSQGLGGEQPSRNFGFQMLKASVL